MSAPGLFVDPDFLGDYNGECPVPPFAPVVEVIAYDHARQRALVVGGGRRPLWFDYDRLRVLP